ncbi:MAG TPA: hydroxymethylglutaryl-CoA reductase [Acidobacteriota bacterium]|nr:hydroxymethylglutaryl-CoA reductase [Acidobacteriota bacterium]
MKSRNRFAVDPTEDLVPRLKDQGYDPERVSRRRAWVEERTGAVLRHVGSHSMPPEEMRGNIENPVGAAQIPLGVAGPLLVRGRYAQGTFYVPLATTEGALVRSYERGMVALTHAGGVETTVVADENQISPSFFFNSISEAGAFIPWLEGSFQELKREAESTTKHGRLQNIDCYQIGTQVIANFGFETGDAQGMNMIVKAADQVCRWIAEHYTVGSYFLFSGMCSEKRPSGFLLSRGKGKWVTAGAHLNGSILKSYLGCTAEQLHNVWHSTVLGHLAANSIGYNGQFANGLTAIFIATGQDVANVVNSACGITSFKPAGDGLDVSLTLPALSVATVGGGTGLATQRECLEMLGCHGSGKARKFAEIVAAALLGGEISMGGAIASGEFATAHERYGRNRPKAGDGG